MKRCCNAMKRQLDHTCDQHGKNCPDRVVLKSGLPDGSYRFLLNAENAAYDFTYCPWCGEVVQEALDGVPAGARMLYTPEE